jgi:hypothetical protein
MVTIEGKWGELNKVKLREWATLRRGILNVKRL